MNNPHLNILLADDDTDDCIFFREALEELPLLTNLKTVNDGVQLMQQLLQSGHELPNALFLDLNMPLKNGFECLAEIKSDEKLKPIPVIILSTSFDPRMVKLLHEQGAAFYIRKPAEFSRLKEIISKSLDLISKPTGRTSKENFVLNSDNKNLIF